jgi:hypothetical protein
LTDVDETIVMWDYIELLLTTIHKKNFPCIENKNFRATFHADGLKREEKFSLHLQEMKNCLRAKNCKNEN